MGEPGTQLTMRTFHTGGAYEGSAGEGVQAKHRGLVRVSTTDDKQAIEFRPSREQDEETSAISYWKRAPQGDIGSVLAKEAELHIYVDGEVVQSEKLEEGSLLKVWDGQEVTRGQVIYERPLKKAQEDLEEEDLDTVAKPINCSEAGEVIIQSADTQASCIDGDAKLVWVLQGTCSRFEQSAECTVTVRQGDVVEEGVPLAQEWAATKRVGVPRFQMVPRGHGSSDSKSAFTAAQQDALCLRTDFDWFYLGGDGRATEYRAAAKLPKSLIRRGTMSALAVGGKQTHNFQRASDAATAMRENSTQVADPVPIYSLVQPASSETEDEGKASPTVSIMCSPPSQTSEGSSIMAVSRTFSAEHVVPTGGLIVHLKKAEEDGERSLIWSPEEIHLVKLEDLSPDFPMSAQRLTEAFQSCHGNLQQQGTFPLGLTPDSQLSALFTTSLNGVFCFFKRTESDGSKSALSENSVIEENGVLRRECWDRLYTSEGADDIESGTFECVIKPGTVFTARSEGFVKDSSWWAQAKEGQGVYFHQKVVPPGEPYLQHIPDFRNGDDWRVVELLDDPRSDDDVRVLIRPARHISLPSHEVSGLCESRTMQSWSLPYTTSQTVDASGPLVLAYKVTSSLGRHPSEPHFAKVAPTGPPDRIPETLEHKEGLEGVTLDAVREWEPGDFCVVQHSPLGPPVQAADGAAWKLAEPRHASPLRFSTDADDVGQTVVPRRQRQSQTSGLVWRAETNLEEVQTIAEAEDSDDDDSEDEEDEIFKVLADDAADEDDEDDEDDEESSPETTSLKQRATIVILRPKDVIKIPCQGRPTVSVGSLVRLKGALSDKDVAPCAGQVVQIEVSEPGMVADTPFTVTLRRGRAYLVTSRGEIQVKEGSVVQKGDRLGTEELVVPRTTDIVQGLPRIQKLFEATDGILQGRMDDVWKEERLRYDDLEAANRARNKVQQEIVAELQSVYGEQGVSINSKHIEIVVRRMTEKCEILEGVGSLLPGSIVDYADIEAVRALQPTGQIRARPLVRGVTSVGKDGHVLVSMSFREVDNVLVSAVLSGSGRHKMEGVKENLMVGKRINVGTVCSESSSRSEQETIDLDSIPEDWPVGA
eukprot:TRINITY_DN5073_c0_g1_i2.p1 TRINITY_DN5073_c0_g1~~TRINITY_DN5073_c0_g1_i2.p1  ORF type:complete len:1100 (+),score=230.02 TRINITY_DN5073_c0_g1_i2:132-3431(+)